MIWDLVVGNLVAKLVEGLYLVLGFATFLLSLGLILRGGWSFLLWLDRSTYRQSVTAIEGEPSEKAVKPPVLNQLIPAKIKPELGRLALLLEQSLWQDADRQTGEIIFRCIGRSLDDGTIELNHPERLPLGVLVAIDRLWFAQSDGRFGFTAQKQIFDRLGWVDDNRQVANPMLHEPMSEFVQLVGWCVDGAEIGYAELQFHALAPVGHLPTGYWGNLDIRLSLIFSILYRYRRHQGWL